ncbi:hypothetical protein STEG23_012698, partial [Scotinomys teguina]
MARKVGQGKEEEVAQSEKARRRRQFAIKTRYKSYRFLKANSRRSTDSSALQHYAFPPFLSIGSCFSLSLSIPILDYHHTWCCCGIPSDFYCATQT